MSNIGKLFVFEGPDGAGKTTLSKWFAKALRARSTRSVIWSSFPGNERGSVGNLVYKLHHDSASVGVKTVHPHSLQMFHVAAHVDAIESRFARWLEAGTTIVLDRFWWSTWVYGRFAGGDAKTLDMMIDLEKRVWRQIKPANVFLITRRVSTRSNTQNQLEGLYTQLGRKQASVVTVTRVRNNGDLEDAQNQILSSIL